MKVENDIAACEFIEEDDTLFKFTAKFDESEAKKVMEITVDNKLIIHLDNIMKYVEKQKEVFKWIDEEVGLLGLTEKQFDRFMKHFMATHGIQEEVL